MVGVYLISALAVVGLSIFVGYLLGREDREGRASTPAEEEVIEVASDKEVDARVDGARPLDDDLDWLREWAGPGPE